MKNNRSGSSTAINEQSYKKIRENLKVESHQLLWDIAYFTGERWGAILQLTVNDIYIDPIKRQVRDSITFKASTRKDKKTRQVPVHPELKLRLQACTPPTDGYFFFSKLSATGHLTMRAADRALRRALKRLGWENLGISTHGTRRGFITNLHSKGISIRTIQSLTGHKSLNVLDRYIDVSDDQRRAALSLL